MHQIKLHGHNTESCEHASGLLQPYDKTADFEGFDVPWLASLLAIGTTLR